MQAFVPLVVETHVKRGLQSIVDATCLGTLPGRGARGLKAGLGWRGEGRDPFRVTIVHKCLPET